MMRDVALLLPFSIDHIHGYVIMVGRENLPIHTYSILRKSY